jgi:adenylate cyclase class 2
VVPRIIRPYGLVIRVFFGGNFMHTEYEVRILEINIDEVKEKLKKLNAKFEWDLLQKRYVYDFIPKVDGKWIRLRTNGKKTTLTIKNIVSSEIDGTQELEIEVDNFDRCNLILKELGYEAKGYQENRRVQYILNGVEVDIDYWPMIPTYLEIEGPSEEAVYNIVETLGFSKEDCTTKDVEKVYLDYGYNLEEIYNLSLEEERKND